MNSTRAVLIIPAYDPPREITALVKELRSKCGNWIVVIDDGSSEVCRKYLDELKAVEKCVLLEHRINHGKGRALKTAFEYLLKNLPDASGAVTADCDGQHSAVDILKCMQLHEDFPEKFIIAVRDFSSDIVPWRSRFGNRLSRWIFSKFYQIHLSDTQSGLRCIPRGFLQKLMDCPGNGYEFESLMLCKALEHDVAFIEYPMETIYVPGNPSSHYRVIRDTFKIASTLLRYRINSKNLKQ